MMKRTKEIDALISSGNAILDLQGREKHNKQVVEHTERFRAWTQMLEKAKKALPESVRHTLTVLDPTFMDQEPPSSLCTQDAWFLDIEHLAPIKVKFTTKNEVGCYVIPRIIVSDHLHDINIFDWDWVRLDIPGLKNTGVITENNLPLALAKAQRVFNLKLDLENEYNKEYAIKAEGEYRKIKELIYEPVEDYEPKVDQALINKICLLVDSNKTRKELVQMLSNGRMVN